MNIEIECFKYTIAHIVAIFLPLFCCAAPLTSVFEEKIRTIQYTRCFQLKRCISRDAGYVWESTQKL